MSKFWPYPLPFGDNGIFPVSLPRMDQRQESFNAAVSPWLGYDCAQTFIAGITGLLRRIELNLKLSDAQAAARVSIWNAYDGLPSSDPADFLGHTRFVRPLTDGWNVFTAPRGTIALTSGREYAVVLETTSVCDWRVNVEGRLPRAGALCQRFGTRAWEIMLPVAAATFRTYA